MRAELRKPLFWAALIAWLLVVLVEVGSSFLPVPAVSAAQLRAEIVRDNPDEPPPSAAELGDMVRARREQPPRPGYAITALVAFDAMAFLSLLWMGAGQVISRGVIGRVQGVVNLIVALVVIVAGIVVALLLFALLMVMLGLFLAPPFGTLAYLAIWGFFPTGSAAATLGLLLLLKLAAAVLLIVAHQGFLKNKGLLVVLGLSLLLTVLIGALHDFPPGIVASIADVIAALIALVVAIVWAILVLIGSIVAIVKAILSAKRAARV